MIDTGGPAFPLHSEVRPSLDTDWCGMTLRDYFAAKTLQALLTGRTREGVAQPDVFAEWAYKYADAMLAEKNKS